MQEIDWGLSDAKVLLLTKKYFSQRLLSLWKSMEECCYEFGLSCSPPGCPLLSADRAANTFLSHYYSLKEYFYHVVTPDCSFQICLVQLCARKIRDWSASCSRAVTKQERNKSSSFSALNSCQPPVNGEWAQVWHDQCQTHTFPAQFGQLGTAGWVISSSIRIRLCLLVTVVGESLALYLPVCHPSSIIQCTGSLF